MLNSFHSHPQPIQRARRRFPQSKSLLRPGVALLLAQGLAQSTFVPVAIAQTSEKNSLTRARQEAYGATEKGDWRAASNAWREVLRLQNGNDSEAQTQLTAVLAHLQSQPENYEGLVETRTTVEMGVAGFETAPLQTQTRANAAETPRKTVTSSASAQTAKTPIAPTQTAKTTTAKAQVVADERVLLAQNFAPRANPNATQPPVRATNATPVAFRAPAPRTVNVSAQNAAAAWPLVNQAARELAARRTQNALSLYRRAYALNPRNEFAAPGVATSLGILVRWSEAATVYRNYLAISPRNPKALRGLADALLYANRPREAWGVNNYHLTIRPNDYASLAQNAEIATNLGAYSAADTFFTRASRVASDRPELWAAWGESMSYRRDPRAVTYFRRALSQRPNFTRATLGLANYYSFVGDFEDAVPQFRAVLAREPRNVAALVGLGDALNFSNQHAAAIAPYRSALQIQSGNRAAQLGLGRAFVYAGRYAEGAAQLNRVLAAQPNNAAALEALALAQSQTSPRAALSTYARLLPLQSGAARAQTLVSIADLRAAQNDFPGAIAAYSQASALAPRDAKIQLAYAQLLAYNNQWSQAAPIVERAVALAPNNPRALALQVQIASQTGDAARAELLAQRLENVAPASVEESLQIADALREVGNTSAANRFLSDAARKSASPDTSIRLANALRDSGEYDAAITIYNRVLLASPDDVEARIGLAQTQIYARDLNAARAEIERILTIAPNNQAAKLVQANLNLAQDTAASRDEAGRIAAQILQTDPNNAEARVTIGQVFSARARFAEAVEQFRIAVAAQPNNAEARLALARNLYYARDVEGAVAQYREIIRRAPADTLPRLELAQIFLDRNRFSDAETLFNEVLALRKGEGALSSVRSAIETRSLARLSPAARFAPLRSSAEIRRISKNEAPKTATLGAKVRLTPRVRLAQGAPLQVVPLPNASAPTASVPAAPAPSLNGGAPAPTLPVAPVPSDILDAARADEADALRGLGEIRRRQLRYTEAIERFRAAIAANPSDVAARVGLAQSLRSQSNFAQALAETERALAVEPASIPARVIRAQLLADTGNLEGAKSELDELLGSIPENAPLETYLALANALNTLQNYPAAIQLLDAAAQTYPTESAPLRLKAETLGYARRFDESIALFDQILTAQPNDTDAMIGRARVYSYSNRLPEAETFYRQILIKEPENYTALVELADVLGRRAKFGDSIAVYQDAIEANPTDLQTRVNLAKVQRYSLDTTAAETTLNAVLAEDARFTPALVERGILRGTLGNYAAGLADLNAALAVSPTDLNAQIGLAEVQSYAGQYEQSIAGYRAALLRDPQNVQARTQLGLVLSYAGQNAEALKEIAAVLAQNSGDLDARLARADILARSNRTNEAVSAYNAILAADPNNVRARTGLADAYLYGRRFGDAVRVYDGLIAAQPANTNFKIQRARALGYSGRAAQAVRDLRAIVAAQPANLPARLALAEAGINSGDPKLQREGIGAYRAILASQPNNVPAKLGLARGLSYVGNYGEAKRNLNEILTAAPDNTDARFALAETQRFAGEPFDARDNYNRVLSAQPTNAQAQFGLRETRRNTTSSLTIGGGYYSDSNGVRVRSLNISPTIRTRALTIGAIVERGKFRQGGVERDRNNIGITLGKQFGPLATNLTVSRLRYDGAPNRTLFDANALLTRGPRERYFAGVARRDIFESDAAVAAGITATIYRAGFAYPLARQVDLEGTATYYRYSDDNNRISLLPALYYRFAPTNPSLRVGVGYSYDNTDELRPIPGGTLYYTPRRYSAAAILADYVVDQGPTRYGIFGAYSLTSSTGDGDINRPADTLFGNIEHDVNDTFSIFANGGLVRSPDYRSEQINGGVTLRF